MNVKTCVQNNSIWVIGHNYINNGCTFNPSKQLDSWDDKDEDCDVNYFIYTHIDWDTTYQSMNAKSMRT